MNVLIALFIIIYFLLCFYVSYNGWIWLKQTFSFKYKKTYILVMTFLSFNIIIERFFSSKVLAYMSGMWMVIVGYSLILLPIMNLLYFLLKKRGVRVLGSAVLAFFTFIFIYGSYLAWNPVVRTYEITVDKPSDIDELTVMLVSDLHLGKVIGSDHLQKLVDITNERKPDMILMAGDLVDDHVAPFIKENMRETMSKIEAPLGVYATPGNHDHYGGDLEQIIFEMEASGITVLDDDVITIEDSLYIIGRDDQTDIHRKSIDTLMEGLDRNKPMIMLDHQPIEMGEAARNGVDVFVAGHTHRGQLAPGNIITNMIFENDYGYLKIDDLHTFVTSGFGFWGPPFRIGSQSEIVEIKISFQ